VTGKPSIDAPATTDRRRLKVGRSRGSVVLLYLAGSLAWALAMGASSAFSLLRREWQNADAEIVVVLLFAFGGLLAYAPAILITRQLARSRVETRFCAMMVLLAGATIAITAFLFGYRYRLYYSEWHEPAFTIGWTFQYVFTIATACYHFLVLGLRMYLPLGFVALVAFSVFHAGLRR
jgi:hypothetical protein